MVLKPQAHYDKKKTYYGRWKHTMVETPNSL